MIKHLTKEELFDLIKEIQKIWIVRFEPDGLSGIQIHDQIRFKVFQKLRINSTHDSKKIWEDVLGKHLQDGWNIVIIEFLKEFLLYSFLHKAEHLKAIEQIGGGSR